MRGVLFTMIFGLGVGLSSGQEEERVTKVFTNVPESVFEEGAKLTSIKGLPPGAKVLRWKSTKSICVIGPRSFVERMEAILNPPGREVLHVLVEAVEVEGERFREWIYENPMKSDATALREELAVWIDKGRARVVDANVVACGSGQRALTRSGSEYIYPVEMDPPEAPSVLELVGRNELVITPTSVTAYKTRDLGTRLEVDPVLGADGVTVDLNLAPERVAHGGDSWWPVPEEGYSFFQIRMPTFIREKITTQVTTHDGRYVFLGGYRPDDTVETEIEDPFILVFARADVGPDEEGEVGKEKE